MAESASHPPDPEVQATNPDSYKFPLPKGSYLQLPPPLSTRSRNISLCSI